MRRGVPLVLVFPLALCGCHLVFPFATSAASSEAGGEAGGDVGVTDADGVRADGAGDLRPTDGALPPQIQWVKRFGGAGYDYSSGIAVAPSGDLVLCGYFTGPADFGATSAPLQSTNNSMDAFLAAYTSSGAPRWANAYGSPSAEHGTAVAADASGNVLLTGDFWNTVTFGGSSFTSLGKEDAFLAGYDSAGAHRWSRAAGSGGADTGRAVAVDALGNSFFVGVAWAAADFGGGLKGGKGNMDVYVASYNPAGTHRWSASFGDTSADRGQAVAVDGAGNVYVAGDFASQVSFGGTTLSSAGSSDIFLASFSSTGDHLWSKGFGGTGADLAAAVAVDASANVYLVGSFEGPTIDLGGGLLKNAGQWVADIVLASFTSTGKHRWSRRLGGSQSESANGLALDSQGRVLLTGGFYGATDLGGGSLSAAASSADIFIASYASASGAHRWSMRLGGTGTDRGMAVAADSAGILVTGGFSETVDFGGTPLSAVGSQPDIFLLRLKSP